MGRVLRMIETDPPKTAATVFNLSSLLGKDELQTQEPLPLIYAESLTEEHVHIGQIVEDVLTTGGLSVMYGEPNSGKSFFACDMDCAIATGRMWLGKRTVRAPVLYVAGEGAQSIKMRLLAWRQHYGDSPWLAVVPVAVNLLDRGAHVACLVDACHAVSEHYGEPVQKITVDTLARAFGGGNENASEDMGAVIAHADELRSRTGAHVMFVHHSGKDAAKGSRGHSSLHGATDTEIEVTADATTKTHTAEIAKQRDLASRGERISARFLSVQMGIDLWGKPVTTCVVEPTNEPSPDKPHPHARKASDLRATVIATLAVAPNRTMRRGHVVANLVEAGFTKSPAYRALDEVIASGMATETSGIVYLLRPNGAAQ